MGVLFNPFGESCPVFNVFNGNKLVDGGSVEPYGLLNRPELHVIFFTGIMLSSGFELVIQLGY